MLLQDMEPGFQYAFCAALQAYRRGNSPNGCAIVDKNGRIISIGENSIYATDDREVINGHSLAHAEVNAILKIHTRLKTDVDQYELYTTMEPCPLCFGAIVMGHIHTIHYAAADKITGATILNKSLAFIVNEKIQIIGPEPTLQVLQIALLVYRGIERKVGNIDTYFEVYSTYCPTGVQLGKSLYGDERFRGMMEGNEKEEVVINHILAMC